MKRDWLTLCQVASTSPATYWTGGKKILRNVQYRFPDPMGPISLEEIGYTQTKMSLLKKAYIHEESLASAVDQWNNRKNYKAKAHWSVGFSCYNHILKSHSKMDDYEGLGSVMGPCLQSVTITHTVTGVAEVDVFYRTTEVFKKFPADLILLRDNMLSRFDFDRTPINGMTIHAANLTVSPTYAPNMMMLVPDPIKLMEEIRVGDVAFHRSACRWALKLLAGAESKFNQARRTQRAVKKLMSDDRQQSLIAYFNQCYPELKP